jgi:hypothetical protein
MPSGGGKDDVIISMSTPGALASAEEVRGVVIPLRQVNEQLADTGRVARAAGDGLVSVDEGARRATRGLAEHNVTHGQAQRQMHETARESRALAMAAHSVGGAFTQISPEIAGSVGGLAEMSREVQHLTHLLGATGGIVLGTLIGGIALYNEYLVDTAKEEKAAAEEAEKMAKAFDEARKAAALHQLEDDPDFAGKLAARTGKPIMSEEDIGKKKREYLTTGWVDAAGKHHESVKQLQDKLSELEKAPEGDTQFGADVLVAPAGRDERQITKLEYEIEELKKKADALTEYEAAAYDEERRKKDEENALAHQPKEPKKPKDKELDHYSHGVEEYAREQAVLAKADEAQRAKDHAAEEADSEARLKLWKSTEDERVRTQRIATHQMVEAAKLGALDEITAEEEKNDKIISLAEVRAAREKRIADGRKKEVSAEQQAVTRLYEGGLAIGIQSLNELAKGHHITGKMILAEIGDMMVGEGTRTMFQGLALSADPLTPGMGSGLIGIGLAEIASGISIGAATHGASASGGGAGGHSGPVAAGGGPTYWDGHGGFERGTPVVPLPANNNGLPGPINITQENHFHQVFAPTRENAEVMMRTAHEGIRTAAIPRDWAAGF